MREAIRTIAPGSAALIQDADEAWRAFHAGSYKAAVIMAGATLEGVLQAAVARLGEPTEAAFNKVYPARKAPADADSYRFEEALGVLKQMGVLTSAVWGDGLVDNPPGQTVARGDTVRFIALSDLLS